MKYDHLQQDAAVWDIIRKEEQRQNEEIELIASENYVSPAVLEAMATVLTNKYSEGYSGHRYYGGNYNVDDIENLAIERAKQLFHAEHVNVQPLSGSPANAAVYMAFLNPGDKVLGLKLDHGGHLSHGHRVNFSGRLYNFVQYGVDPLTGVIDMAEVRRIALAEKPKMIVAGFSAYSREIDWAGFKAIADEIGAYTFADIAHIAGLIAAGQLKNPVPIFDVVSTTTHKTLRGPRGGLILMGKDFENPFGVVAPKSGRTKRMSELIDSMVIPGIQGGPLMHVIAGKAVAFLEALRPEFTVYGRQVIANAQALAARLMAHGYYVVSNGTDNHLMLVDLRNKGLTGKEAQEALDAAGITVNKNGVPFDDKSPLITSGIRIGTPASTTRGMREEDMGRIAGWIAEAFRHSGDAFRLSRLASEVKDFSAAFPIPGFDSLPW